MISPAISGKATAEKNAIQRGMEMKDSFANNMSAPEALEMPENISESGLMLGSMVMAKP